MLQVGERENFLEGGGEACRKRNLHVFPISFPHKMTCLQRFDALLWALMEPRPWIIRGLNRLTCSSSRGVPEFQCIKVHVIGGVLYLFRKVRIYSHTLANTSQILIGDFTSRVLMKHSYEVITSSSAFNDSLSSTVILLLFLG